MLDENLVFYEPWELAACVDGALLAAHMGLVNTLPFTYQQLGVFKRKLDEVFPDGLTPAHPTRASPVTQSPPRAALSTGLPRVPGPGPQVLLPRAHPRGHPQVERDIPGNRAVSS